jgi:hypothetical protein
MDRVSSYCFYSDWDSDLWCILPKVIDWQAVSLPFCHTLCLPLISIKCRGPFKGTLQYLDLISLPNWGAAGHLYNYVYEAYSNFGHGCQ